MATATGTVWDTWNAQWITITDPLCPIRTITTIAGVITGYTTVTCSNNYIWADWNDIYTVTGTIPTPSGTIPSPVPQLTREQSRVAIVRDEADKKANALLRSLLTPEQRKTYEDHRYFDLSLTRKDGSVVRYRIRKGAAGNIYRLADNGASVAQFCIHAYGSYPDADHMIAQKLLLESDEAEFLRIANKTDIPQEGVEFGLWFGEIAA